MGCSGLLLGFLDLLEVQVREGVDSHRPSIRRRANAKNQSCISAAPALWFPALHNGLLAGPGGDMTVIASISTPSG